MKHDTLRTMAAEQRTLELAALNEDRSTDAAAHAGAIVALLELSSIGVSRELAAHAAYKRAGILRGAQRRAGFESSAGTVAGYSATILENAGAALRAHA